MFGGDVGWLGSNCLYVQTNHADLPIAVLIQNPDLVESPPQINRTKRAILVEFKPILIGQVNALKVIVLNVSATPGRVWIWLVTKCPISMSSGR